MRRRDRIKVNARARPLTEEQRRARLDTVQAEIEIMERWKEREEAYEKTATARGSDPGVAAVKHLLLQDLAQLQAEERELLNLGKQRRRAG